MDKVIESVQVRGNEDLTFQTDTLVPKVNYRCIVAEEDGVKQFFVYGILFDEPTFKKHFIDSHEVIMKHWQEMSMFKDDGKPLSKTAFKKRADIHIYRGHGRRIWLFRTSASVMYGFYPRRTYAKDHLDECYRMYMDVIGGNLSDIDCGLIQFGNKGIPLGFGNLGVYKNI